MPEKNLNENLKDNILSEHGHTELYIISQKIKML